MIIRALLSLFALFWLSACTQGPDPDTLPQEEHDVVVLGGSVYGVTVASALKGYDETIDVVLMESEPMFVTEPYLNLFLSGKMDQRLLFTPFSEIAKRRGFLLEMDPVVRIDREAKRIIFNSRVIRYNHIVDARYRYGETDETALVLRGEYKELIVIREKLTSPEGRSLLIDASALADEEMIRAEELYNVLNSGGSRHVALKRNGDEPEGSYTLVITYPPYESGTPARFSENFFVQYNRGLEMVAEIVREVYGGSFLPNMVKEERFIYQNSETLEGIDPDTNTKHEGTEYLSKIIKIQRDFM